MSDEFPFSDRPDTACFTCFHVIEQNKPILYVSHDEDGYWQFLCGCKHTLKEARIVSLAEIVSKDERVSDLAGLGYGHFAESEDIQSDWVVRKK